MGEALIAAFATITVALIGRETFRQRKMARQVDDIDHAVNQIDDGEPPLIDRVNVMERGLNRIDTWRLGVNSQLRVLDEKADAATEERQELHRMLHEVLEHVTANDV